jgi:hypothetical protein
VSTATIRRFIIGSLVIVALAATVWSAVGQAGASQPALAEEIPFETIEEGSTSHFDYSGCLLAGSEFVFTERGSWERFWEIHSSGRFPAPPLPDVKFAQETVVVVLLGCQSGSEGPSIRVVGVERIGRETRVHVLEDRRPGVDLAIGNAFQIVKIPRVKGSISFLHEEISISDSFCSTEVDCHPAMICDFHDSSCRAPYLEGTCVFPDPCPDIGRPAPVCGCDGVTYNNDCLRINAGAVWKHGGICR